MNIKYFCDIAVFWRRPLKGNKGPTQCTKCSMYGQGAKNCNRTEVCNVCAGSHDVAFCTLNKGIANGSVIYKCYNCMKKNFKSVNHRADDPMCPCRKEYLDIRQRITSRSGLARKKAHALYHIEDEENFPQLPNHEKPTFTRDSQFHSNLSFSKATRSKKEGNNSDNDISNEKLLQIFFEAVDALQRCQNKYDKLRVLGMMLKHAI